MKQATKLLALAALLIAGQAICSEVSPIIGYNKRYGTENPEILGKDVSKLKALLEQRKTRPNTPINMPKANLWDANLSGSNLSNAHLSGAHLFSANLADANLTNATLIKVDFHSVNLSGANLTNADLKYSEFFQSKLLKTNLSGADLSGALLSASGFVTGATGPIPSGVPDLTNANLSGATITKTNFTAANLTKVNFTNCKGFETTIIDSFTNFQDAIGLTPEQKAYARSKGAQNVPN